MSHELFFSFTFVIACRIKHKSRSSGWWGYENLESIIELIRDSTQLMHNNYSQHINIQSSFVIQN